MESATAKRIAPDSASSGTNRASGWHFLWFFYHVAVVYVVVNFCTPWLAWFTRGRLLPLFQTTTTPSSQFEFFFSHLLVFSAVPGFLAGLSNGRPKHMMAVFVWILPAAILVYKLLTFSPAVSVLNAKSSSAFHHYFGGGFLIPEYRDWQDFRGIAGSNPDMIRGMEQATYTAPLYAALVYSAGVLIAIKTELHHRIVSTLGHWEDWKFGNSL